MSIKVTNTPVAMPTHLLGDTLERRGECNQLRDDVQEFFDSHFELESQGDIWKKLRDFKKRIQKLEDAWPNMTLTKVKVAIETHEKSMVECGWTTLTEYAKRMRNFNPSSDSESLSITLSSSSTSSSDSEPLSTTLSSSSTSSSDSEPLSTTLSSSSTSSSDSESLSTNLSSSSTSSSDSESLSTTLSSVQAFFDSHLELLSQNDIWKKLNHFKKRIQKLEDAWPNMTLTKVKVAIETHEKSMVECGWTTLTEYAKRMRNFNPSSDSESLSTTLSSSSLHKTD